MPIMINKPAIRLEPDPVNFHQALERLLKTLLAQRVNRRGFFPRTVDAASEPSGRHIITSAKSSYDSSLVHDEDEDPKGLLSTQLTTGRAAPSE